MTQTAEMLREAEANDILAAMLEDGWSLEEAEAVLAEAQGMAADDGKDLRQPMDKGFANWILGKMAKAQQEQADIDAMLAEEVERLTAKADALKRPASRACQFFTDRYGKQLEEWAAKELEGEKKTRSIGLLHGKVGFRKNPDKVVYDADDEQIVLNALRDDGYTDCIRVKEEVSKTALKDLLKTKPLSYAHIEEGGDVFYIKAEA